MSFTRHASVASAVVLSFLLGDVVALDNLVDVTSHTVSTNPQVRASRFAFEEAAQERKVARGAYFPQLDIEAGIAQEYLDDPRFPSEDFSRDAVTVRLSQMLFDGFETKNEVARLGEVMRARYFELRSASEDVAAEATRAYVDVLRHRHLLRLSEDNYATHRSFYEQIERRVSGGLSRRSDLDQAGGRLALAESNLLTDMTNLHDVSMRYQRIVGELPDEDLREPTISDSALPASIASAVDRAINNNPLLKASTADVLAAQADSEVAKAPLLPRFDIQARQEIWNDKDNIDGRYEEGVIELVGRYNLFNGYSHVSRRRQRLETVNMAKELRDQSCRNVRQEVTIAYNEARRLREQLTYLDRHVLSIGRAREAYRDQFDVGQRTLLDMLDAENEYYEASRSYVDAERDLAIAVVRTQAVMGELVDSMGLTNSIMSSERVPAGVQGDVYDAGALCPPETELPFTVDKDAIYRRALERRGEQVPD